MFADTEAFSGFSVSDIDEARKFYAETLGLRVTEQYGLITLQLAGGPVRRRQAGHGTLDPGPARAAPLAAPVFQLRQDQVADRCWHRPGAGRVDGGTAAGEGILRHRIAARPGQVAG